MNNIATKWICATHFESPNSWSVWTHLSFDQMWGPHGRTWDHGLCLLAHTPCTLVSSLVSLHIPAWSATPLTWDKDPHPQDQGARPRQGPLGHFSPFAISPNSHGHLPSFATCAIYGAHQDPRTPPPLHNITSHSPANTLSIWSREEGVVGERQKKEEGGRCEIETNRGGET